MASSRPWPFHDDERPSGSVRPLSQADLQAILAHLRRTPTDTFLGERYRRLVKRRGKPKALVAVARSILVIVWHLLADPTVRFHDLGPDYYTSRIDTNRKARNHIRQLQALGFTVTLTPAA